MVRRVAQHAAQRGGVPALQSGSGGALETTEPAASFAKAYSFNADPAEYLTHYAGFVFHHLNPGRTASGVTVQVAIAIRHGAHGADRSRHGRVPTPTPTPLENAGTLVFGDHTLDLQEQVVLGRATDRAIEEHHLDTGATELFHEQHLKA